MCSGAWILGDALLGVQLDDLLRMSVVFYWVQCLLLAHASNQVHLYFLGKLQLRTQTCLESSWMISDQVGNRIYLQL